MGQTCVVTLLLLTSSLCCRTDGARVATRPDSAQLFDGASVSLSCEDEDEDVWTLRRNTTMDIRAECVLWGRSHDSSCSISPVVSLDSGTYWCESREGGASDSVNITVTGEPVILQGPVRPVTEGHEVTLRCRTKTPPNNHKVDFYKDGVLIRAEPTGHTTILRVSKSDEGAYTCAVGGLGRSPPAWLRVTAAPAAPPTTPPPAPPTTPPPSAAVIYVASTVGGVLLLVALALLLTRCVRRTPEECDAAPVRRTSEVLQEPSPSTASDRAAVRRTEDVVYARISMRGANVRGERRLETEVVYSSLMSDL